MWFRRSISATCARALIQLFVITNPPVTALLSTDGDFLAEDEHVQLFKLFLRDELWPPCRDLRDSAALKAAIRNEKLGGWMVLQVAAAFSFDEN